MDGTTQDATNDMEIDVFKFIKKNSLKRPYDKWLFVAYVLEGKQNMFIYIYIYICMYVCMYNLFN